MKRLMYCVVVAMILIGPASAQSSAPTLTDVEKLQLQNALQQVEIATLRAQALLKKFEREGYTLDLQSLTYTKNEVPKK